MSRKIHAAQLSARLQILWEFLEGTLAQEEFLLSYPEARTWFDDDGVPTEISGEFDGLLGAMLDAAREYLLDERSRAKIESHINSTNRR